MPSFYPAYFYGAPIRSSYELCRNLALLGCEVRVLTTDAGGLHAVLDVEKDKEVPFEGGFRVRYCHRHYAILCPQSCASIWSIHSLGGNCPPHRSIQLPHVPDTIPLPGAQETCRLVAARRIAVLGRLIPPHPEGNLGVPLVYHQVEMMGE